MKQKVLVLGASGLVGKELINILSKHPNVSEIHLLTRRELSVPQNVKQHIVDFEKLKDYFELFKVDITFCALGTTIKKAKTKEAFKRVDFDYCAEACELAHMSGCKRFSIVSAIGANSHSKIFYSKVKGELEEHILSTGIESVIVRPSLLVGERKEERKLEKLGILAFSPLRKIMLKSPLKYYAPIPAHEVAQALVDLSFNKSTSITINYQLNLSH